ncbi:hypothetical protein WDV93_25895 [Pantoea ananatis]
MAPCVSAFAALHPHLALSLQLSSQPLNFLDAHVDIDIRVGETARLTAGRPETGAQPACTFAARPPTPPNTGCRTASGRWRSITAFY